MKNRAKKIIIAAMCIIAAVVLLLSLRNPAEMTDKVEREITVSENGVTIPKAEVYLGSGMMDMEAFFIYNGRVYVQFYDGKVSSGSDIIGEHLGKSKGRIDEWTARDGYTELAGSVVGDFYSVKGYNPEFMLCMRESDGDTSLYINNNDITVKYGRELFEDRLYISDGADVSYESRVSVTSNGGKIYKLDENTVDEFVQDICEAEFIPTAEAHINDSWQYNIYLKKEDGINICFSLCRDGYVTLDGMSSICVKLPDKSYEKLINRLNRNEDAELAEAEEKDEITLEDCMNDKELGRFIPKYIPDGFESDYMYINYYIDSASGKIIGTKEISIGYSHRNDDRISYGITVTWLSEYGQTPGWAGPLIDREDLTAEKISEFAKDNTSLGINCGDVMVIVSIYRIDAETACEIFKSVKY